jgi:autotransporter adhesin
MKKIFFVLLAGIVISFFCFVQLHSANADETKIFIGKVEKVTPLMGKPPAWTYNKIVVNDDKGTQETFFVMKATVITDVSGKDISGSGVTKDKKVEIKYSIITNGSSITNGKNGADSIKYLD